MCIDWYEDKLSIWIPTVGAVSRPIIYPTIVVPLFTIVIPIVLPILIVVCFEVLSDTFKSAK